MSVNTQQTCDNDDTLLKTISWWIIKHLVPKCKTRRVKERKVPCWEWTQWMRQYRTTKLYIYISLGCSLWGSKIDILNDFGMARVEKSRRQCGVDIPTAHVFPSCSEPQEHMLYRIGVTSNSEYILSNVHSIQKHHHAWSTCVAATHETS